MKNMVRFLLRFFYLAGKACRMMTIDVLKKKALATCGKHVRMGRKCVFSGIENVFVEDDVSFGENMRIMTTRAKVYIGSHVMFAPNVTIVSGNHRIDVVGKYMSQVTDSDKLAENDRDVCIKDDVWIGTNVVILGGVTIGSGAVIGAGSVVTRDIPDYAVAAGNPAKVIKFRFSEKAVQKHREMLGI